MAETKTYDPGQVVITFGPALISDYMDGSFVRASRMEDTYRVTVGADGKAARAKSRNKAGTIEVTLKQTSPSNDVLAAAQILDELTGGGIMPAVVKDLNGTTLAVAQEAWVKRPADIDFGKDIGGRVWIIETGELTLFSGGATS